MNNIITKELKFASFKWDGKFFFIKDSEGNEVKLKAGYGFSLMRFLLRISQKFFLRQIPQKELKEAEIEEELIGEEIEEEIEDENQCTFDFYEVEKTTN